MKPDPSITVELQTLGALLRTPLEAAVDHVYGGLAKAGFAEIRLAHGDVFRHLSRHGSRITTLAERAHMTKQSMAELVEYLSRHGFVELVADPSDGRAKLVKFTARGWKVHYTLVRLSKAYERKCARSMGQDKWRQLRALLQEFAAWSVQQRE